MYAVCRYFFIYPVPPTKNPAFGHQNPVLIWFDKFLFLRTLFTGVFFVFLDINEFFTGWKNMEKQCFQDNPVFGATTWFCSSWAQKPGFRPTS